MKKIFLLFAVFAFILTACEQNNESPQTNNGNGGGGGGNGGGGDTTATGYEWVALSNDFPYAAEGAAAFVINNKAYVGTGKKGFNEFSNDFYKFDGSSWTSIEPFSNTKKGYTVTFTLQDIAYIGTGITYNNGEALTKSFRTFSNEIWGTINNNFNHQAFYDGVGFSLNGKGYFGTGYDENYNTLDKFFSYDGQTWKEIAPLPKGLAGGVAFSLNGKGYVGTGISNGNAQSKFYQFDPNAEAWSEAPELKIDGTSITLVNAVAFTMGDSVAYVGTGTSDGSPQNAVADFYKFDGISWEKAKTLSINGVEKPISAAVAFTLGDKAYVGTGVDNTHTFINPSPQSKFYVFQPKE